MIFVTVGTHEQQFDCLVKYMDQMKREGVIEEEIIIQTGYSTYEPEFCKWSKLFPYQDMVKYTEEARIVITHGGPSSFILPLQLGKIPVVIPRRKEFGEHVNNHQVDFSKAVEQRQGNIIVVNEIDKLAETILNYENIVASMHAGLISNNEKFILSFEKIADELVEKGKKKR